MKKKGSAILTVIGSVSILIILAFAFLSSRKEKAGISKLMSDEKKMEALAESASDYILKVLKRNANTHDNTDPNKIFLKSIYYLLRAPLKAKGTGDNFALDISSIKPDAVSKIENVFNYKTILDPMIEEIGWKGKVEITSSCEIISAEYFTPDNLEYKVATINYEHLQAEGNSAKFLDNDSDANEGKEISSDDWSSSQWELRLKFPKGDPTYEEKEITIEVHPLILPNFDEDITLKISRDSEESNVLKIRADDISIIGHKDFDDIDIQEKMDNAKFFPDISPKTLQGLRNGYTTGTLDYDFSKYVTEIRNRKTEISNNYSNILDNFDINNTDFNNPYYLEKGAILRIKTNVKYKKSENNIIEKTLVSEIPYKACDVQNIAPEYTFFIANTPLVSPQKDIVGHTLGTPIEINKSNSSELYNDDPPSGELIVHNVPVTDDKVDYDKLGDKRIPGMIRINSNYSPSNNQTTKVRSFLGLISRPELSELNKFFTPFNNNSDSGRNKFNTRISFAWEDTPWQRYHELEFPLLFEHEKHNVVLDKGIKNVVKVFDSAGFEIISVPTLLFGICHLEYPLGLRAEGPIDSIYSRTRIKVQVEGEVGEFYYDDNTIISFDYEPLSTYSNGNKYDFDSSADSQNPSAHATFGMQDYPGYNKNSSWDSNTDAKYCPANCYDALQYAKKATKYYESASDFISDLNKSIDKGGLLDKDGNIELNGVYYVKDGAIVFNKPLKYKGNGLIVSKIKNIIINQDITRADDSSTLGLIARTGYIHFNTPTVMAACFSNNAPTSTVSRLNLYGNLVCNNFKRDKFVDTHIYYDNTICNVAPLASLRKIGKFEPKRYAITFADNWSKFTYEKK